MLTTLVVREELGTWVLRIGFALTVALSIYGLTFGA